MPMPSKYRYDDRTGMVIPVVTLRERLAGLGVCLSKTGRTLLFPFSALLGCCLAAFATFRRCGRTICPFLFSPFVKCWRQVKRYRRDEDWLMVCVWLGIGYVLFRIYRYLALLCIDLFAIYILDPLIRVWHSLTGFAS